MNKRICVVGAGYWGKNHIKTLVKLKSLGGVVDLDPNILKKISSQYRYVKVHSILEDALLTNYDGYVIATPAITHFELAKQIILAKKDVLIEKPMTLSIKDSEDLVVLSKKWK